MIFHGLELHNYGPYLGRHEVDLSPGSIPESGPLTLIGGMNGCGKTSILDAIRLVLYGARAQCSTRGSLAYKEFLRESVNRHVAGEKSASVELKFAYQAQGVETKYTVRRSWTCGRKDVSEVLLVLRDGKPDSELIETWDETVEELIPLGISNLFLFDGEQVGTLAEQDTPPPEVRLAIRSLLGLDLIDRLTRDLDVLVSRKRKESLTPKAQKAYAEIEGELEAERARFRETEREILDLGGRLNAARDAERREQEQFSARGGELALSRTSLERERAEAQVGADAMAAQLREWAADVAPLALIKGLLGRAVSQAEEEVREARFRPVRQSIQERDARLVELLDGLGMAGDAREQVRRFLDAENVKRFGQAEGAKPYLGADERSLAQLKAGLETQIPKALELGRERSGELDRYLRRADGLDAKLAAASTPEDLDQLLVGLTEAKAQVASLARGLEEARERKETISRLVERLEGKLKSLRVEQGDLFVAESLSRRVIREAPRVQETLLRYQERLSAQKISRLEDLVTKHFQALMRKEGFVSRVKIDAETYAVSVTDEHGGVIPKQRLSAGEKQLLAVALLWGLGEASGRALPVVVDTPLGRLDSSHRGHLIDRYFPHASHQVIVLSTDTEFIGDYVARLRDSGTLAREYLLDFDDRAKSSVVKPGYFV